MTRHIARENPETSGDADKDDDAMDEDAEDDEDLADEDDTEDEDEDDGRGTPGYGDRGTTPV
jgi:hypothetical protein